MKPILLVALDFINLSRALKCAEAAVKGGADWLEAGTPLIKSEGLDAVRALRKKFPHMVLVADMKVMDAGRTEVEAAAKAGADIIDVCGAAPDAVIRECIEAARNYGAKIVVDMIGVEDPIRRAREVKEMGADYVAVHCAIDEQMQGKDPFDTLRRVAKAVDLPIGVAGGINSETAPRALKAGASVIVVGGAVTKAKDPAEATRLIKKAIQRKRAARTFLFKRVGERELLKIFRRVSTANISDAMHRAGDLKGILPAIVGAKMAGRAFTVRTYPGDWSKPVQAIDKASAGDVIVIDAGGVGPAVWGELATHGAAKSGIAGVVVEGAIRDLDEIRKLKFPAFARLAMPNAGEPKGFGEMNVPVTAGGVKVFPGDWIVGDRDGVVCVPRSKAVEIANRAMSVLELENRLRQEIDEGSTLGKVINLLRWDKKQ